MPSLHPDIPSTQASHAELTALDNAASKQALDTQVSLQLAAQHLQAWHRLNTWPPSKHLCGGQSAGLLTVRTLMGHTLLHYCQVYTVKVRHCSFKACGCQCT